MKKKKGRSDEQDAIHSDAYPIQTTQSLQYTIRYDDDEAGLLVMKERGRKKADTY